MFFLGPKFEVPEERLPIAAGSIEKQINSLVSDVFQPAGFIVDKFTKLPYLCEGDLYNDYFVLNDFVFVLKLK